jgi:hypothetical protein
MPRLFAAALVLGLMTGAEAAHAQPVGHCVLNNNARTICHPTVQRRRSMTASLSARRRFDLVTVTTAAGIDVTVARAFAPKIEGFIADLVARGYRPRRINCYARSGHVRHSLHHSGRACDFDQRGWNKTAHTMYHIGILAAKWGLRDGCTFRHPRRDCGHIDVGLPAQPMVAQR